MKPENLLDINYDVDMDNLHITSSHNPDVTDLDYFTHGSCHEFALAFHRLYGWAMLVCSSPEAYGENEDGETIDSVIHVYAINPETDEAYDIRGKRPGTQEVLSKEIEELYHDELYSSDYCTTEEQLMYYVDNENDCERPLTAFKETDIQYAMDKVRQLFPNLCENNHFNMR